MTNSGSFLAGKKSRGGGVAVAGADGGVECEMTTDMSSDCISSVAETDHAAITAVVAGVNRRQLRSGGLAAPQHEGESLLKGCVMDHSVHSSSMAISDPFI